MKNLTVSLDDETYRKARVAAAQRDTSISKLVKAFLENLSAESEFERLHRQELAVREEIKSFDASQRVSRDEAHERKY